MNQSEPQAATNRVTVEDVLASSMVVEQQHLDRVGYLLEELRAERQRRGEAELMLASSERVRGELKFALDEMRGQALELNERVAALAKDSEHMPGYVRALGDATDRRAKVLELIKAWREAPPIPREELIQAGARLIDDIEAELRHEESKKSHFVKNQPDALG